MFVKSEEKKIYHIHCKNSCIWSLMSLGALGIKAWCSVVCVTFQPTPVPHHGQNFTRKAAMGEEGACHFWRVKTEAHRLSLGLLFRSSASVVAIWLACDSFEWVHVCKLIWIATTFVSISTHPHPPAARARMCHRIFYLCMYVVLLHVSKKGVLLSTPSVHKYRMFWIF